MAALMPGIRFLAYGLLGSAVEGAFTSAVASFGARRPVVRGPSTPAMVGLYGLAMPFFEMAHDRVRGRPAWQRGAFYAAGVLAVETMAGLAWRRWGGTVPWEYGAGLTVARVARLDYAPAWALLGLAAERLDEAMRTRSGAPERRYRR